MSAPREIGISRSRRAREELAKAWLLDVLERTPLEEMERVPISWIASEGPPLIADIVRSLGGPAGSRSLELPAEGIERIGELGELRGGRAAFEIPRDLAALQALLIEALRREIPERRLGSFAGSVERLAEIFGDISSQVTERLVRERSGGAAIDQLTGLPGSADLYEWLRILLAEQRRYGHPFSLLTIDIEGLGRINQAYGHDAGDQMLRAVAGIVKSQVRAVDRAFRPGDGQLCVLAPHQRADQLRPMAQRLCDVVDRSQASGGPRVAIAAGIACCPDHADGAEALIEAAEEAAWAAKAEGRGVALGDEA
jgi:diguanylate cyclase (GGDEF)-like protein